MTQIQSIDPRAGSRTRDRFASIPADKSTAADSILVFAALSNGEDLNNRRGAVATRRFVVVTQRRPVMTTSIISSSPRRHWLWISSLIVASILFTFGFACALPLAAFAAVCALTTDRREALAITGAIWLANQIVGFAFLHYPTDTVTLAWGAALGVIALLSCETAGLAMRRIGGVLGSCAAFLAAFIVYEGAIYAICLATDRGADDFTVAVVSRIFLINASAFLGLWAWNVLSATVGLGRKPLGGLALRHV
jgi:hypothetical protein